MNIWMKSVMKMRGEVQSYYDSLLKAQGAVEKARLVSCPGHLMMILQSIRPMWTATSWLSWTPTS